MEFNQKQQRDVGASKAASAIIGSLDSRLRDPAGSIIRLWGFALLLFVIYLVLVGSFKDLEVPKVIRWLEGYGIYLLMLELSRVIATRKYDSALFRGSRVIINLVIMSFLMSIPSDVRPILAFAYTVPVFASIVYFSSYEWVWLPAVGVAALGLYLGGIAGADYPLDIGQYIWICLALVAFSYIFNWFYRRTIYRSNNRLDDIILGLPRTLDLQQLMSATIQRAIDLARANRGLLIVIHPRNKRYVDHQLRGLTLRQERSIEDVAKQCYVLSSGEPFECPDLIKGFNNKSLYHKYFEEQPRSVMAQPLFDTEGQVFGVLNVAYDAANRFDSISQNDFHEFTLLVSSMLENCFVHRELKLREARNRDATERFVSASSEDEVIQILVEQVHEQIPHAEALTLHRFRHEDDGLIPMHRLPSDQDWNLFPWSDSGSNEAETRLHLGQGIAGHALEILDTILVNDVARHPWYVKLESNPSISSLLVAPIFDFKSEKRYGTVSLESGRTSAFGIDDETMLTHLSTHASLALTKFREFQGYVKQGGALLNILGKIRSFDLESSESQLSQQITDAAVGLLGFRIARLRILSEDQLVTVAVSGLPGATRDELIGTKLPYTELLPFLSPKFKAGSSYLIRHGDAEWEQFADKYFSKPQSSLYKKSGWHQYDALLIPFLDQSGSTIGLLTLDVPITGLPPDQKVLEPLDVFASAASWIIELARFQRRLLEQRHRTQSFIDTISRQLAKCRDLPTICEVVVQVGAKFLSAEACSLFLVHGNEIELTCSNYLANTDYVGRRKPISMLPKSGLTAWVAATGQVLCRNKGRHKEHEAWAEETEQLPLLPSRDCLSLLLVPVKDSEDKVMGVISLENKTTLTGLKDFDEEDIAHLESLADEFARALQVIGLYEEIKQWERTGLADDIHDLVNLHHSGIINLIEAIIEWLRQSNLEKVNELVPQLRQHAFTFVQELKTLHTNFLDESFEKPNFSQALEATLFAWTKHVAPIYKGKMKIRFSCPENLEIPAKIRNTIIRIASLAFSNALQYSGIDANPGVEILVSVEQNDDKICLSVIDNGRGIDFKQNPPGYGIDRMKQLAEKINHWGEMQSDFVIHTKPNEGTKVSLVLTVRETKGAA